MEAESLLFPSPSGGERRVLHATCVSGRVPHLLSGCARVSDGSDVRRSIRERLNGASFRAEQLRNLVRSNRHTGAWRAFRSPCFFLHLYASLPPIFTSHNFVYTDPVGFSSLFINVMNFTAINPTATGLSNRPDLAKI